MNLRPTLIAAAAALAFACNPPPPPGSTPCVREGECGGFGWECMGLSSFTQGYCQHISTPGCSEYCGDFGFCDAASTQCVYLWDVTIVQPHEGDSIGAAGVDVVATSQEIHQRPDGSSIHVPGELILGAWKDDLYTSVTLDPPTVDGTMFSGHFTPPVSGQYVLGVKLPGTPGSVQVVHVTATVP